MDDIGVITSYNMGSTKPKQVFFVRNVPVCHRRLLIKTWHLRCLFLKSCLYGEHAIKYLISDYWLNFLICWQMLQHKPLPWILILNKVSVSLAW